MCTYILKWHNLFSDAHNLTLAWCREIDHEKLINEICYNYVDVKKNE